MPQGSFTREIEKSRRPCFTKFSTSLRRLAGWMKPGWLISASI